jgi:Mg2+ and Co2+ transporter CorA
MLLKEYCSDIKKFLLLKSYYSGIQNLFPLRTAVVIKNYLKYVQGTFANKINIKHKILTLLGLIFYVINIAT